MFYSVQHTQSHTCTHTHTHHTHPHTVLQAYQQYQDVRYVTQFMDDCGVEDELNPEREPFEASFSRLMDLSSHIEADEEPPVVSNTSCLTQS